VWTIIQEGLAVKFESCGQSEFAAAKLVYLNYLSHHSSVGCPHPLFRMFQKKDMHPTFKKVCILKSKQSDLMKEGIISDRFINHQQETHLYQQCAFLHAYCPLSAPVPPSQP
jgi:hypothetical protein